MVTRPQTRRTQGWLGAGEQPTARTTMPPTTMATPERATIPDRIPCTLFTISLVSNSSKPISKSFFLAVCVTAGHSLKIYYWRRLRLRPHWRAFGPRRQSNKVRKNLIYCFTAFCIDWERKRIWAFSLIPFNFHFSMTFIEIQRNFYSSGCLIDCLRHVVAEGKAVVIPTESTLLFSPNWVIEGPRISNARILWSPPLIQQPRDPG